MLTSVPSVLISGAGPTGLTLAALLARAGVSCRIVDALGAPRPWARGVVVIDAGLAGRLGVHVPALIVLRPDGFLGWIGFLDVEGLAAHFDRLLGRGPGSG